MKIVMPNNSYSIVKKKRVVQPHLKIKSESPQILPNESFFKSILDNSHDVISKYNLKEKKYEYISPSVKKLTGYSPEEFSTMGLKKALSTIHPEDLPKLNKAFKQSLKTGEAEAEYRLLTKAGKYIWVSNRILTMKDRTGKPHYRLSDVRDITHHKQVENNREHFASFPKTNPNPVIEFDLNQNIIFSNPAARKALQNIRVQGGVVKFLPPDIGYIISSKTTKKIKSFYRELELKNHIFAEDIYLRREENSVRFYIRDITERKNFEKELLKINNNLEKTVRERTIQVLTEKQRLYNVLDTIPAYIILLDENYEVPFANKYFQERFGKAKNRKCYQFLFKRHSPCPGCETYKVLKTQRPHRWEWTGPDKHIYDIYDFPFTESGSKMILEMGIDITKRRKAEDKLKQYRLQLEGLIKERTADLIDSERKFSKAFHASPVAMTISKMPGGIWIDVNNSFVQLSGYQRQEILGHRSTEHKIFAGSLQKHQDFFKEILKKGVINNANIKAFTKQGRILNLLFSGVLFQIKDQKYIMSMHIDITERLKLEKQKDDFINIASHELKTPLTSIKAFTQILGSRLAKSEDKSTAHLLSRMEEQINKLAYIVSTLLDVTKIQSGSLEYNREKFDLGQMIKETAEDIYLSSGKTHRILIQQKKRIFIQGDKFRLSQVISNLLTNAIKYSPQAKKVVLIIRAGQTQVRVLVRDYGIGIPKENVGQLFDKFYRGAPDQKIGSGFTNLGLGLYICSQIIKKHHGTIGVKSTPGKGSTFYFTLPLKP